MIETNARAEVFMMKVTTTSALSASSTIPLRSGRMANRVTYQPRFSNAKISLRIKEWLTAGY